MHIIFEVLASIWYQADIVFAGQFHNLLHVIVTAWGKNEINIIIHSIYLNHFHMTINKTSLIRRILFNTFLKGLLCSPRLPLFLFKNKAKTVILGNHHHYSSLRCHMILQKSFWYADCISNIFYYYQCHCAASYFCRNHDTFVRIL